MMSILHGSLLPCQNRCCKNTVRLFKDFTRPVNTFRCSECLALPGYSVCKTCNGLCMSNLFGQCFVCAKEKPMKRTIDPKLPPTQKPRKCQRLYCDNNTSDIIWTYDPYTAEICNEYEYGWWCKHCLQESAMDV